jgi:hypothetical protein
VEDSWKNRDLPVLAKIVELVDEATGEEVPLHEAASALEMDITDVGRAAVALNGEFIHLRKGGSPETWSVTSVTSNARRIAGQWPRTQ